jgi:hypothetical protein
MDRDPVVHLNGSGGNFSQVSPGEGLSFAGLRFCFPALASLAASAGLLSSVTAFQNSYDDYPKKAVFGQGGNCCLGNPPLSSDGTFCYITPMKENLKPKQMVRRFDVFAEYQRLKALKDKSAPDEAKGYGIWLAKVVAARRFRKERGEAPPDDSKKEKERNIELVDGKWHVLGDEPQTDDLFDKEIIRRMGEDFYKNVFSPAVEKEFNAGKDYTEIRDAIRKDWKP